MGEPSVQTRVAELRRLESWKEIAAYLNRDVTTVQRWEKREGMPVYRHVHDKRGSVYAVPEELDIWLENRRPIVEEQPEVTGRDVGDSHPSVSRTDGALSSKLWWAVLAAVIVILAGGYLGWRDRRTALAGPQIRSLAVLPLRNLSGDPAQE